MRPLMRTTLFPRVLLSLLTLGCGGLLGCGGTTSTPDAGPGVDTSCGIDCAAQQAYGLITHRCFEYTNDNATATPPDLGAVVEGVVELEGGTKGMRVSYWSNGLRLMEDTFLLVDGALKLARRTDPGASSSVTYVDDAKATVGVTWVQADSAVNQNFTDTVTAVVANSAGSVEEATTFRGNVFAPSVSEKTTPAGNWEDAIAIGYTETPDHTLDPRRVFVRGTGFVQINTRLSLDPADTATPYKLQGTRELTDETQSNCGSQN